jgi:sugar phosphate isomerase/epimerase
MGYKLEVPAQLELAAAAGYQGVELWLRDIERFVSSGGKVADLRKRLDDLGLVVVGGINFNAWASNDESQRRAALETMRRDMDWIAALGGQAIAAAPAGIFQPPPADLRQVAERYRALLELGEKHGVVPQLEIWGASATLSRVSEALFVAAEAGHPQAQILLDVFHMYKGGSSPESLRLVHGKCMTNFHMNDYPADPPREAIRDSHRVFPGDGVGPVGRIVQILYEIGFRGALSLELFNAEYWKRPALEMTKEGLAKMKAVVEAALAS